MNDEAFSSVSPQRPVALIDLVETKTAEANAAFVTKITQLAEDVDTLRQDFRVLESLETLKLTPRAAAG